MLNSNLSALNALAGKLSPTVTSVAPEISPVTPNLKTVNGSNGGQNNNDDKVDNSTYAKKVEVAEIEAVAASVVTSNNISVR